MDNVNPYREVALYIDNVPRVLVYDWRALAQLRQELGENFLNEVYRNPLRSDLEMLCKIIVIGLRRNNPEVTIEDLMNSTLPLFPTAQIVTKAMNLALHGVTDIEKEEESEGVKENPTKREEGLGTLLKWLSRRLSLSG